MTKEEREQQAQKEDRKKAELQAKRLEELSEYYSLAKRVSEEPFSYETHNPMVNRLGNLRTSLSNIDNSIKYAEMAAKFYRREDG